MSYIEKDKETTKKLYEYMCKLEGVEPISLRFRRLSKASGSCAYINKRPIEICVDIETGSFGAAYVLIHEFAHKLMLLKKGDATHSAAFRREVKRLEGKYANCKIANELIF